MINTFDSNTYFNYSTANATWTFSDDTTLDATYRYKFTHTWDITKDIQFSPTEKVRWAICDCTSRDINFSIEASTQNVAVIGVQYDNCSLKAATICNTLHPLRWVRFTNGSKFTVAANYGGYFQYAYPVYIDGMNWESSTSSYSLVCTVSAELRNFSNINTRIEAGIGGRCSLSKESLDAIYNACSQQTTTVRLSIGSHNYSRFTAEQTAQLTEWGYTMD